MERQRLLQCNPIGIQIGGGILKAGINTDHSVKKIEVLITAQEQSGTVNALYGSTGAGCGRSRWTQGSIGFQENTSLVLPLFLRRPTPGKQDRSEGS